MIATAVEKLRKAMIAADRSTLDSLTMDELSYGHTSGLIEDKEGFIGAITDSHRRDVFKMIELSDQSIITSGDVAVVRHRFVAEVEVNGNLMRPDIRVIQVWQQKGNQWKLLARQAYKP